MQKMGPAQILNQSEQLLRLKATSFPAMSNGKSVGSELSKDGLGDSGEQISQNEMGYSYVY